MCGRYTLTSPLDDLLDVFDVPEVRFEYRPRYNIAPTQDAPVLAQDEKGRRIGLLRWGLVPSWSKDPAIGNRLINARSESVAQKPSFRFAFRRRRCIVLADGFYEWSRPGLARSGQMEAELALESDEASEGSKGAGTRGKGGKAPYWIHLPSGKPFGMAGIWERWNPPRGDPLYTFTILTTDASLNLRPLHHRMPVIVPPDSHSEWLDPEPDPERLQELLVPFTSGALEARQVSTLVNSPGNDTPACLEPVT